MRARRYSILVLAAVLAACGSPVPVGAVHVDTAQAPAQARVAEPAATAGEVNPKLPGVDVHAPALMSTQEAAQPTYVTYPRELHGHWVGTSVQCPRPDYAGDTELVLEISSNEILGYEEIFRAVEVLPSSTSVASWRVETMIDVGPSGVFEKYGPITFTISGDELSVTDGPSVKTYKKCSRLDRAAVEYPPELRGAWMPSDMGCPSSINRDGEDLLSIGAGMLGQYENTSKPLRVDQISKTPSVWRVLTTFSPGTGEYEGRTLSPSN